MCACFLHPLASKSAPSTAFIFNEPSIKHNQISLPFLRRSAVAASPTSASSSDNSDSNGNVSRQQVSPPVTPPNTVEIKFKGRSRRRSRRLREDGDANGQAVKARAPVSEPPKKWEDMSFREKAIELYVGEKGMLFWLNKFAYASIFIVIGGWIIFRFVGPSLNLYQLDTPPLAPESLLKGS